VVDRLGYPPVPAHDSIASGKKLILANVFVAFQLEKKVEGGAHYGLSYIYCFH